MSHLRTEHTYHRTL